VLRNAMLAFDAGYAYQVGDMGTFAWKKASTRMSTASARMAIRRS
jgi:hypothetical protein